MTELKRVGISASGASPTGGRSCHRCCCAPRSDGRGGALPPPGFSGSMEAAKDSVGADLCVGPWASSAKMACPGGHTGPPLRRVGRHSGANRIGAKHSLPRRGGARPLQWGPEPDGRGGALLPPGFPGSMEAAKDSVGADLCVGPWADPGRMTCPGGHTGPPLRREGRRSGANRIGAKHDLTPAGRGGARPLQWGPEPDGRGGAPSPPDFPGSMEAAKDSVGADLCVGP